MRGGGIAAGRSQCCFESHTRPTTQWYPGKVTRVANLRSRVLRRMSQVPRIQDKIFHVARSKGFWPMLSGSPLISLEQARRDQAFKQRASRASVLRHW